MLILGSLGYGALQLQHLAQDANRVPIRELVLLGERQLTHEEDVAHAIESLGYRSLLNLDVNELSQRIEALPWIDKAAVRREWPNRIQVMVEEHQPLARWGNNGYLNQRLDSFIAPQIEVLAELPRLSGPVGTEEKVWQMWQQLVEILAFNGYQGQDLQLTPRHAWTLRLDNGIELVLGRSDTEARLQRFLTAWPQVSNTKKGAARIDLRYDTGFAVQWQE